MTGSTSSLSAADYRTIGPRQRRHRSRPARWYRRNERTVLGLLGVVGFFVIWQIGAMMGWIDAFFFSSPLSVLAAGAVEVHKARFWEDVKISSLELVLGSLAALALAVPLGLIVGWYQRVTYTFDPWLNFFNALPRIALLPLVVLWVGLGLQMKILIVFLGGFFSIIMPTAEGVRTVDRQFLDVARSYGASERRLLVSVVVPATIPFIVTGIRLAIGRALIGVIVGEMYAQTEGLGVMIDKAEAALQSDRMLFGVLIFTLAGILSTEGVGYVERYLQRWRPSRDFEETN